MTNVHVAVVGKVYGRLQIKSVKAGTECAIREDQCGFRKGRGCMDQVCAVRQVCEKYVGKMYSGSSWIWKRPMILSIGMVCGRC